MKIGKRIILSEDVRDLSRLINGRKVFAIVDDNVMDFPFVESLERKVVISASEEWKTISTVETISRRFMQMGADRDCLVLGVGGGIICDLAGFVAATYKRGVSCGLVPTTLLAQIDASIGGKNGVNVDRYKNMIGTVRLPQFIFVCPPLSHTTTSDVDLCGEAEMLKAFIIGDADGYAEAVGLFRQGKRSSTDLIRRAIKVKMDIVSRDLHENGERRLLNLGHTIGHAIEKWSPDIPHGRAVATGIAYSASLSAELGLLSNSVKHRITEDLLSLGFDTHTDISVERLMDAIVRDKKREGDCIDFVLINDIGKVTVKPLNVSSIRSFLDNHCSQGGTSAL